MSELKNALISLGLYLLGCAMLGGMIYLTIPFITFTPYIALFVLYVFGLGLISGIYLMSIKK